MDAENELLNLWLMELATKTTWNEFKLNGRIDSSKDFLCGKLILSLALLSLKMCSDYFSILETESILMK